MICIFALMLCFTEMEDDEELERMMLSISPSKLQGQLSKKTSHRHRCTGFVVYGDKICLMTWV